MQLVSGQHSYLNITLLLSSSLVEPLSYGLIFIICFSLIKMAIKNMVTFFLVAYVLMIVQAKWLLHKYSSICGEHIDSSHQSVQLAKQLQGKVDEKSFSPSCLRHCGRVPSHDSEVI